ncbi:MAG: site-2 protease family protein [Thermoanaerobaculia bacterium]|nr:site-2 protease family protein [Thermoanaerobaculia bacterium]
MFGKRFELFQIFGFKIRIDSSWFLLAILITWSLATGYFPMVAEDLTTTTYWVMGAFGALGLFASVVFHELSHSLMARQHGVEMEGITLFIFGGVAEMRDEPPSPKAEFQVAIAGPIASVVIAGVFWGFELLGGALPYWSKEAGVVLGYLAFINVVLALFNLIPGFPLDGGRVLRSILWKTKGSLREASRIASQVGSGFGVALIVLGLISALTGNLVGGIWWFILGLFLRGAARMSYRQVLLRQALEGEPVRRFMEDEPITVPRSLSVRELVEDYIYEYHYPMFPVVDDGRLVGCVTTDEVQQLPREEWDRQSVGAILKQCGAGNTVAADEDAMEALSRMSREGTSRLMVVEGEELVGILTLKDLLDFFSKKIALEDLGGDGPVPEPTSLPGRPGR